MANIYIIFAKAKCNNIKYKEFMGYNANVFENKELYTKVMENVVRRLIKEGFYDDEETYPNDAFDASSMTKEQLAKWCQNVGDFFYIYKGLSGWKVMNANIGRIVSEIVSDLYNCERIEPTHEVDNLLFSGRNADYFKNNNVCVFKIIGDEEYYVVYLEGQQDYNVWESVRRRRITESFKSSNLRNWFKQHKGVKKTWDEGMYMMQDGLGDVSDEDIVSMEEVGSRREAANKVWQLNHGKNRKNVYYTVYQANDGNCLVVGLDRNTVKTGPSWGGELTKKRSDRLWGYDKEGRSHREGKYIDDSDTYYYSRKGQDFGLHNNRKFQGKREDNERIKSQMSDDEWNDYQERRIQHMDNYLKNNYGKGLTSKNNGKMKESKNEKAKMLNENYKNRKQVSRDQIIDILNATDDSKENSGLFATVTYLTAKAIYKGKRKGSWRSDDVQSALEKHQDKSGEDWYQKLSAFNQPDVKGDNPIYSVVIATRYKIHWHSRKHLGRAYDEYSRKLKDLRMKHGIGLGTDGMLGDNHNQRQQTDYGPQLNQTNNMSRDFNMAGAETKATAYFCDENGNVVTELPMDVVYSMAAKKTYDPYKDVEAEVKKTLSGEVLDAYAKAKSELVKTFRMKNLLFDKMLCIAASVNGQSYYYINDKVSMVVRDKGAYVNQQDMVKIAEEQLSETFEDLMRFEK